MSTYIEYELEDGKTVLVEVKETQSGGMVKVSRGDDGNAVIKAGKKFGEAFESVKAQAIALRKQLEDARADEVQVRFSLKTTGQMGNFAVGTIGAEAVYEVTLKWKNE